MNEIKEKEGGGKKEKRKEGVLGGRLAAELASQAPGGICSPQDGRCPDQPKSQTHEERSLAAAAIVVNADSTRQR